jgi:transposase
VVCHNPLLAEDRRRTRQELLEATEKRLRAIAAQVKRRTRKPLGADEIGLKVGKALGARKMAKHFILDIAPNHFQFERDVEKIEAEAQRDGIYIIRTSESDQALPTPDAVRAYKSLADVEQAFRCLKSVDLHIRPIHHRTEDHVRAHVFLAVLAYYVDWHMRRALAPVLFEDEDLQATRRQRDPVVKAKPSPGVQHKKRTKATTEGWPVHNFASLLADLATRCRNTCRTGQGKNTMHFEQLTEPTPFQRHTFELLGLKPKACAQ